MSEASQDINETIWAQIPLEKQVTLEAIYAMFPPQKPIVAGKRPGLTPPQYPRMFEIAIRAVRRQNWEEAANAFATLPEVKGLAERLR